MFNVRDKMKRFTLERGKWYACELIGDDFTEAHSSDLCSYSPIKVEGVFPLRSGDRTFRFHPIRFCVRKILWISGGGIILRT
jgi:hypothetical protein